MAMGEAAEGWADASPIAPTATPSVVRRARTETLGALVRAGAASTLHRLRRGEGALPAVNVSLLAYQGLGRPDAFMGAVVSVLAIAVMYALNDLWDAPADARNPKKDQTVVATYLAQRGRGAVTLVVLHLATIALALATLGPRATAAVAGVMVVNLAYSTMLKGVPVVDVVWCGLWGALYAAIVEPSPWLVGIVGLMTAVCHLYQALDDRVADAANAITTTAVRSPALSRNVLAVLSASLAAALAPALSPLWALSAFTPLAIYFACDRAHVGWLLTKAYFGVMWLAVLGGTYAAG
jgi:4-hydroxybenzoate polyprenyltransferase